MSQIVDDLRQVAIEIKTETQVGGNTAARVGGAFERVADALEGTQQIEDMDAAVAAVQQAAQENEQTIQDIVNNLAVVQTTGQSTSAVMSQKAVTDELLIDGDSLSMGSPINYIISTSSWVWTRAASKHYLVKVNAGDKIKVTANSNNTAVCIWLTSNATPSNNNPAPVVSQSATTIQANENVIITAPQTTEYLYLMGVHSSVEHKPSSVIKMDGLKNVMQDFVLEKISEHENEIQDLSERMPSLEQEGSTTRYTFADAESGYYRDTDHAVVDSQYWYHKAIPFDGGENATLYYTSSAGQAAASCFFKVGTSYQRFGQDSGGGSQNPVPITVDIPTGTTEILISVSSSVKDTAYAEITIPSSIPEDAISERMVKDLLNSKYPSIGLSLKKRCASISFIFDDGVAGDVTIKAIFDNHSKKCGFAVFSPIASRYKTYYDEGFEILAHASSPISSPTEASERVQMKTAYDDVVALVGECHGWVTPLSALADQFKPLVYDYYEYGYTVYKGNIATPSESGMTKDMKSYALWRSSVESITLAEQKAIIDYAVANNLMVCFYGHGYNLDTGGNFTSANLNELLSYCDSVGIDVMLPYESVSNFFAFRHNEDL